MDMIKGKWALVTGASRGIGSAVAVGLAEKGCNVVVHARTEANAADTLKRVRECGVESFAAGAALGDNLQLEQMIQNIIERIGGVDVLYNNAAIMNPWKEACEIPVSDWKAVLNVNVIAPARLCAAFIPINEGTRLRAGGERFLRHPARPPTRPLRRIQMGTR